MTPLTITTTAFALFASFLVSADAAVLAKYLDGAYSDDSLTNSELENNPDVTASDISMAIAGGNPGGSGGAMRDSFGGASYPGTNFWLSYNGQNAASTPDENAYLEFSVYNFPSSEIIQLSSVSFDLGWAVDSASGPWTGSVDVQVNSGSGFVSVPGANLSELITPAAANSSGLYPGNGTSGSYTFDLSALTSAGNHSIRLMVNDTTTSPSQAPLLFQNVILNGDLVPEPSAMALLPLLARTLMLRRRR